MHPEPSVPSQGQPVDSQEGPTLKDYGPVGRRLRAMEYLELLLKRPGQLLHKIHTDPQPADFAILLSGLGAFLLVYGLVVGSFAGGWQYLVSPAKIVVGMALSILICLPSLYIFACIGQTKIGFAGVAATLLVALSLMGVLLVGFAPVVWVFSQSTESVAFIGLIHLAIYLVSLWFAFKLLLEGLEVVSERKNGFLPVWMLIFLLVSLQMTTTLRPIIGTSTTLLPTEKAFFLSHWVNVATGKIP